MISNMRQLTFEKVRNYLNTIRKSEWEDKRGKIAMVRVGIAKDIGRSDVAMPVLSSPVHSVIDFIFILVAA